MDKLKGIFFDLDNTLIDRNGAVRQYMREWLITNRPDIGEPNLERMLQSIMEKDHWGYTSREEFFLWIRNEIVLPAETSATTIFCQCDSSFNHCKQSPSLLQQEFLAMLPQYFTNDIELLGFLLRLKQKYVLGLITNGGSATQREKLRKSGLDAVFEGQHIIISGEVGYDKPDPGIFRAGLQASGLTAGEVLYIGDDSRNDIRGAKALGMLTCWMAHGRKYPENESPPDYCLKTIYELEEMLLLG